MANESLKVLMSVAYPTVRYTPATVGSYTRLASSCVASPVQLVVFVEVVQDS